MDCSKLFEFFPWYYLFGRDCRKGNAMNLNGELGPFESEKGDFYYPPHHFEFKKNPNFFPV